jgi:diguanylate cyclase (GGDEF)-like protein
LSNNTDAFEALKAQLSAGGLEPFLQHVRMLAAVLDVDGKPLGWNAAFASIQKAFLAGVRSAELAHALQAAPQAPEPVRLHLDLDGSNYDCFLVACSNGQFLFFGEPGSQAPADGPRLSGTIQELDRVKGELDSTRQALEIKQKELQAVVAQAEEVSHTDALTFLPNRKSMISELQRQVTYAERYGAPLSISMIDIDNFKDINDNLGHAAGDQVLRFIASEMRDRIREPDLIGRYGGDEFLVILPNSTSNGAAEQATRLCQQVAAAPVIAGKEVIRVGMSIGITQYQPSSDTWQTLLERADQAMYQAKRNGRGQWAILKA